MSIRSRKGQRSDKVDGKDGPAFRHASGYTDLADILGEHTLNADREAVTVAPKGYRARSIAKTAR